MEPQDGSVLWLVVVGFIIAFILAFGIGANDVANSFGTSVGSKVLTLFQACVIASIFELAGAVLIGSKVSETVRDGIINISSFNGTEKLAMVGAFSALTGTSIWLLVATFFELPVSATHSIVGGTIGYALIAIGAKHINWKTFGTIAASWVISPIMSGVISSSIFYGIDRSILKNDNPLRVGLLALPFLFGGTMFINLFSIFYSSKQVFGMEHFKWYVIFAICLGCSILLAVIEAVFVNPWLRNRILEREGMDELSIRYEKESPTSRASLKMEKKKEGLSEVSQEEVEKENILDHTEQNYLLKGCENTSYMKDDEYLEDKVRDGAILTDEKGQPLKRTRTESVRSRTKSAFQEITAPVSREARSNIHDDPQSAELFKYLQILTAAFGSFAHGGNDVSNAIGPLITLWLVYQQGVVVTEASIPIWILVYGGFGIVVGLSVLGRRVIRTIGENLTPITPSSGFSIEIGSALTVLLASNIGIPISTTHCKVGSVVFVGRMRSRDVVDWSLFRNIVFSWIITMPVTGGISAAMFAIIRAAM